MQNKSFINFFLLLKVYDQNVDDEMMTKCRSYTSISVERKKTMKVLLITVTNADQSNIQIIESEVIRKKIDRSEQYANLAF